MQSAEIRLGTRGSPLALAQAGETRRRLVEAAGARADLLAVVPIRTTGDRITDRPLAEAGGKGLFTKEIDEALLDGRIDLAVHSAKDLPTRLPDGIAIVAALPRGDVRDAFISPVASRLEALPEGAVLGTSSLRRKALALRVRPDLQVVDLRGNVDTRLKALAAGSVQATLLAYAGLTRLGLADRATSIIPPEQWLPAAGQGVIAITARTHDGRARDLLAKIDDRAASLALATERAFLDVLDGSCRTPIGGLARVEGDRIHFRGIIVRPDGSRAEEVERDGVATDAIRIGRDAGAELRARGGDDFFAVA